MVYVKDIWVLFASFFLLQFHSEFVYTKHIGKYLFIYLNTFFYRHSSFGIMVKKKPEFLSRTELSLAVPYFTFESSIVKGCIPVLTIRDQYVMSKRERDSLTIGFQPSVETEL